MALREYFYTGALAVLVVCSLFGGARAQGDDLKAADGNKSDEKRSTEHELAIYGVKIGMDVPSALKSVFENANRKPGQEKPDAMRKEGKDKKDIRVLYNDLPEGSMQIVFERGIYVREMALVYKSRPSIDDLQLASSSDVGAVSSGKRYDDRYTVGFVDRNKQEKLWWRDAKSGQGYSLRLSFRSGNILKDGQLWWQTVTLKSISVMPGHEKNSEMRWDSKSMILSVYSVQPSAHQC